MAVVPVAKALYLCEEVDTEGGLRNLYGLSSRYRANDFPFAPGSFVVFEQLAGGLGEMTAHVDIRRAADGRLVRPTEPQGLRFRSRDQLIQLAFTVEQVEFEEPGVYLAELYCDNAWVADVTFDVVEDLP